MKTMSIPVGSTATSASSICLAFTFVLACVALLKLRRLERSSYVCAVACGIFEVIVAQ